MTMARPTSRRLAALVAAGLAIALAVMALRPAPVRVDVAPVTRGSLLVTVDEEGFTRVRDRFVVTAPIAGRVGRLVLDAGDAVDEGMVVARMRPLPIDPRDLAQAEAYLEAALATAREADARVERARAAASQAERTARRARRLGAQGILAAEEREQAELEETARARELEAALFAARTASSNVEAARAALLAPGSESGPALATACEERPETCVEIRAPVRGMVLRVPEQSERVVAAGTPLLEIGDPTKLEIVVDVLSADAVKIAPGATTLVEEWGGEETLRARVRLVEPSGFTKISALGVEEQRVNVIADFVEPQTALADGYRIEARIVVWQAEDVIQAPASAIFRRGDAWQVFVLERGRARRRPIEVGQRNAAAVQVLAGLQEGETVIVHPSDQVDDGTRVAPL